MDRKTQRQNARIFHAGMKGLVIGALVGTVIPLATLFIDALRRHDGGSTSFAWFFGIAFGGAIGWFIGIMASRRGPADGPAYPGPERRRTGPVIFGGHDRRD